MRLPVEMAACDIVNVSLSYCCVSDCMLFIAGDMCFQD